MCKIFLTGASGTGKSYVIAQLRKQIQMNQSGFLTLPYWKEDGSRGGFCLHSILEIKQTHFDVRFSYQCEERPYVINGVFDEFGVAILNETKPDDLLIMDELGKLEKNETKFINKVLELVEHHTHMLGVLKKCDVQWLKQIKQRDDVMVLDLDTMTQQQVFDIVHTYASVWFDK